MNEPQTKRYGAEAIAAASDPTKWELWPVPERHPETLYQRFPEFTCLCPQSSYPDFATVHLITVPNQAVVELKDLKLWLNSFRERAISHELATAEIVDVFANVLDVHAIFVLMEYTPRGNLTTFPMIDYRHPRTHALPSEEPLAFALENARLLKLRLLDRVLGG